MRHRATGVVRSVLTRRAFAEIFAIRFLVNFIVMSAISRFRLICFGLAACFSLLAPVAARAVDFDKEIYPVLRSKCFKCHSGPKAKKGLRFDDKRTLKEFIDGEDKVIVTGKPLESLMLQKARLPRDDTDAMPPPRRGDPLSSDELRLVAKWIELGAKLEAGEDVADGDTKPDMKEGDAPAASNTVHTWVNTEGNQVKAGFVRLDEASVVLLLESGKEYPYPLSKLSPESQALAKKLAGGEAE